MLPSRLEALLWPKDVRKLYEWTPLDALKDKGDYSVVEYYEVPSAVKGISVYVAIAEKGGELYYIPIEPKLESFEAELLQKVMSIMVEEFVPKHAKETRSPYVLLLKAYNSALKKLRMLDKIKESTYLKILYYLYRNFIGYGPLEVAIRDPYVEDISVPGVGTNIYVWHSRYESLKTPIVITDEDTMEELLVYLATKCGVQLTHARPIVDTTTPEGFRVNIVLSNVATRGGTATIRRFRMVPFTILELVKYNVLSLDMAAYLWYLIENKRSIIVFGPTGAGKTTLMNAIAMLIRPDMKVITIEDTREINLPHPQWVPLVAREVPGGPKVTLFDLVKASLRQRPDYIIVGEIRGEEAYVLFQAIATGHGGLTTIHADSLDAVVARLTSPPMNIPLAQIKFIDAFVHINRVRIRDRIVRRVMLIAEVADIDIHAGKVEFHKVFRWTGETTDTFEVSKSLVLERIAEMRGIDISVVEQEMMEHKRILEELYRRGALSYNEFAKEVMSVYVMRRVL